MPLEKNTNLPQILKDGRDKECGTRQCPEVFACGTEMGLSPDFPKKADMANMGEESKDI